MGRFYSVDPENYGASEDDPQSWNAYAYGRNNPIIYSDPDGLEYTLCNNQGQCWAQINDENVQKAKAAGGFDWKGGKDKKNRGLDSGIITDSDGNQVGTYQQTSHDNGVQAMVWGAAPLHDAWEPVLKALQPMPLPGGSAVGGLITGAIGLSKIAKAAKVAKLLCCFVAGTPISTIDGLKPIEEIKVGDEVLSYNEQTGQVEYKAVVETFERYEKEILRISVDGEGESLGVTAEHPFYIRLHKARDNTFGEEDDGEWTAAGLLQVGDEIRLASGNWAKVLKVGKQKKGATTYNFEVADNHNYFVGQLLWYKLKRIVKVWFFYITKFTKCQKTRVF